MEIMQTVVVWILFNFVTQSSSQDQKPNGHTDTRDAVVVAAAPNSHLPAYLGSLLKQEHAKDSGYRAMISFPTVRIEKLYAELFEKLGFPVLRMHGGSQKQRIKMLEQFRAGKGVAMFTAGARGMTYTNVSLVVQFNMPEKVAEYMQYIRYLQRAQTKQASKPARLILLLADFESAPVLSAAGLRGTYLPKLRAESISNFQVAMLDRIRFLRNTTCERAYEDWLLFYSPQLRTLGWDKAKLVSEANKWYASFGKPDPPMLQKDVAIRMGLMGEPGLRVSGEVAADVKDEEFLEGEGEGEGEGMWDWFWSDGEGEGEGEDGFFDWWGEGEGEGE